MVFLFADDAADRDRQAAALQSFGYAVRASKTAGGISGGALQFKPAAVIINNFEADNIRESLDALGRLSESGRLACPAIFIGESDDMALRIEAMRAGCSAFLTRPVNPMMLVDTLDRLVSDEQFDPLRVLVVDDSRTTALYHQSILRDAGMGAEILTDPMKIAGPLKSFSPQLLLIDLNMPVCSGADLAVVIRQEEAYESIPIIFLSGEQDRARQLKAMGQGGDDFLTKPIEPAHLVESVALWAERFRRLRSLILCDSLTGLYNHSTSKERLRQAIEQAQAEERTVSSAIIDIDHFKKVNDTYGHPVGDYVIKSMARFLTRALSGVGEVGRIGGEEFAVTLPDMTAASACELLENLRLQFGAMTFASDDQEFQITFSGGVGDSRSHDTVGGLSNAADQALYEAKRSGRNRVVEAA